MTRTFRIRSRSIGEVSVEVRVDLNPKTAKAILDHLPFAGVCNRWGDEVYFEIPVKIDEENAVQDVEVGDIAYWPPGRAMCIFFGRTPASRGDRPRAYSPVNVFGKVIGDPFRFKRVPEGEEFRIE